MTINEPSTDEILNEENLKKLRLMRLGEKIKLSRNFKGFDTKKLGEKLGVSASYITKLETGRTLNPQPEILRKISEILGINYLELFFIMDYIDEKTYKIIQSENKTLKLKQSSFEILDVPIYIKVDIKGVRDASKNKIGNINYLSKVGQYKYLNGYLIDGTPTFLGKPQYTYAIINLEGRLQNGEIGLFNLNGKSVLKRYILLEGKEILIDFEKSFNYYTLSSKDVLEHIGSLIDCIIDLDGTRLESSKNNLAMLNILTD
jgi:transcriptional regulator with XRE-family HTH domain